MTQSKASSATHMETNFDLYTPNFQQYLIKMGQLYGFDPRNDREVEAWEDWIRPIQKEWERSIKYDPYTVFPQFKPQRIKEINAKLDQLLQEQRRIKGEGFDSWVEQGLCEAIEKEKTKLNREKMRLDPPPIKEGYIGAEEVTRAKMVPISEYLEFRHKKTTCLWHDDKHPSMYYYERDNAVKCFACGFRGDVVDVVMKLYDLTFIDAVKRLIQ